MALSFFFLLFFCKKFLHILCVKRIFPPKHTYTLRHTCTFIIYSYFFYFFFVFFSVFCCTESLIFLTYLQLVHYNSMLIFSLSLSLSLSLFLPVCVYFCVVSYSFSYSLLSIKLLVKVFLFRFFLMVLRSEIIRFCKKQICFRCLHMVTLNIFHCFCFFFLFPFLLLLFVAIVLRFTTQCRVLGY